MMTINPYRTTQHDRRLTYIAWGTTLFISVLPEIICILFGIPLAPWWNWAKMGVLLGLTLTTLIWKPLRPLQNFFIIMFIFFGLAELRTRFNFTWPGLQDLFGGSVFDQRMQAEQTGKLAVSCAMIVALLLLGYKRSDFFLALGNLGARMEPVKFLGFPKASPWYVFALQWGLYIAAGLAVMQYIVTRPDAGLWSKIVPVIPSILFYAALNAFNEEMTYRAPMLATLEPVTGSRQALWMAAYFFGIAHYFGTPGGILGGLLSIFMGWILGKGMIETRGLFWSWWIHFLSDVAIFTFLALSLIR